jgi:hypothetical protein
MAAHRLLPGLLLFAIACGGKERPQASSGPEPGSSACRACHEKIVDSFVRTAHFKTSTQADSQSIKGSFAAGRAVLRTARPDVWFKMENAGGVFYQTGFDESQRRSRTERFDLVIGSGRVGQSYVYWKDGYIFELPVSYLTGVDGWINSPGYHDGTVDFGRVITARCLECHSTYFTPVADRSTLRYAGDYMLGISCAKCHGGGREHVAYQSSRPAATAGKFILNPARFSRDRKLDNCALCHSGGRQPTAPSFTYRPGEKLDEYLAPAANQTDSMPDVHGNQVGLLRRSKCFRSSKDMSCSTCHDVHRPQRDLTELAQKCLGCHQAGKHPRAQEIGARMITDCIDCHMPNQASRLIRINTPSKPFSPSLRSHLIGIYPEVAATVLRSSRPR